MTKILLVDDEEKALAVFCRALNMLGYQATGISRPKIVCDTIKKMLPEAVIVDLMMPEMGGLELLREIKALDADLPVIVLTGYGTIQTAVEAMKGGAFDYVTKPYNIDEIDLIIRRAIEQRALCLENKMLREQLLQKYPLTKIITEDRSMKRLLKDIETLASINSTVLITGESGTGKELVAKGLHFSGSFRDRPFVTIDCGGIPETIIESEIFGHVKGAFTGAHTDKKGYLEVAANGTVFFDEVSELAFPLQKKLLRFMQEKEFSRVGDTRTIKADTRIVAATNKDLRAEVRAGRFREDLYYRLNVISLSVPPLKNRLQDIPLLARHFLGGFNLRFNKKVTTINEDALMVLISYSWPGNVRELRNVIEGIVVFKENNVIGPEDLPRDLVAASHSDERPIIPFQEFRDTAIVNTKKEYVEMLLSVSRGNVSRAAAKAQIDRANFRKLMKRFNISAANFRGPSVSSPKKGSPSQP